jgi:hypothetical protein
MKIIDTGGGIRRRVPDDFPDVGQFFFWVGVVIGVTLVIMAGMR